MKTYEDITAEQQTTLATAWTKIYEGLTEYEKVFGVDLTELMHGELWDNIEYLQKESEV